MIKNASIIILISLLMLSAWTCSAYAIHTDSVGEFENAADSLSNGIIVSYSWEGYDGIDFNGDGDSEDSLVRSYSISTGTTLNVAIGSDPAINGNIIAFETSEWDMDEDLNGDGDKDDEIIRYYDIETATTVNTGSPGRDPDVDGNLIAFHTSENSIDTDLNSDGDKYDSFITYYDILSGTTTVTDVEGDSASIDGNMIAFETTEQWYGTDLNGDADTDDYVIRYYDIGTDTTYNTEEEGSAPSIEGNLIVFYTDEDWIGLDLNGDGFLEDWIIRFYDTSSAATTNTGVAGRDPSISLGIIAFQTAEYDINEDLNGDGDQEDNLIRYYYLPSGTTMLAEEGNYPTVDVDTIAFFNSEYDHEADLNGDGDETDYVIGYYIIPPEFVIPEYGLGTIMALMGSLSALIATRLHNRKKHP